MSKAKLFSISKRVVFKAYKRVKANQGAAGVDGESIEDFEKDLKNNLYKIWNRMSSGSYFPPGALPNFQSTQWRITTMGHAEVQKVTPSQTQSFSLAWAHCQTDVLPVCALAIGATIGWSIGAG